MCSTSPGKVVCASTSKMFSEDSSCKARLVTTQAFIVLAIVVLFPLLVLTIVRRFLATGPAGAAASRIPALVDVVIGLIAVLCLTIAWGVFANMHKGCICPFLEDEAGCTSCGLNYSFALAIIAWLAAGAATVFLFLGKNENAGYTDLSAPTLV
ncbi:amastin, putative [Bodo saltans]|uniref:Amastin, putative n=1 Tax=Bodo saltans TaxID=75058 RepID=A0A0S4J8S8_BODSA|nr:amastin, putative [Bodo saltans]|eukprot:CUG86751.1 amastin, putative [Bodo saltans]